MTSPVGQGGRHVLHRVDGEVERALEQSGLDLLGEQALAADLGQRPVLDPVALRAHDHDLDRGVVEAGLGREQGRLDHARLRQGQRRAAGAEPER